MSGVLKLLIFLVAARVSVTLLDARFTQFVVISLRRNRKAPPRRRCSLITSTRICR